MMGKEMTRGKNKKKNNLFLEMNRSQMKDNVA
jgi:hypothetical protein